MTIEVLINKQKMIREHIEQILEQTSDCMEHEKIRMQKDFWLYELANVMEKSKLDLHQRTRLLQLMLDMFQIRHQLLAEEYFDKMSHENAYYKYMVGSYGVAFEERSLFWEFMYEICMNDSERQNMIDHFIKDYGEFIADLETYLADIFPTSGFGEWIPRYVIEHMIQISELEGRRNGEKAINIWRDYCKAACTNEKTHY